MPIVNTEGSLWWAAFFRYIKLIKIKNSGKAIINTLKLFIFKNQYIPLFMKLFFSVITLFIISVCQSQEKVTLDQIVAENKGKVILVDYWASWCKPCRKEMPDVHKLHEYFKGKDVVFVYLSMDIETDKWEEAAKKEGITNEQYSYMSTGFSRTELSKSLKVQAIPRYVIFDKNGALVNPEAARPSEGKKLRNEIEKYLAL